MNAIDRLATAVQTAAKERERARAQVRARLTARRDQLREARSITEPELNALDQELAQTRGQLALARHEVHAARAALQTQEDALRELLDARKREVGEALRALDELRDQLRRQARVRDAQACFVPDEAPSPAQLETRLQLEARRAAALRRRLADRARLVSEALEASSLARSEAATLAAELTQRRLRFQERAQALARHHGVNPALTAGIADAPRRTARRLWRELFEPALALAKAEREAGIVGADPLPDLRPNQE